MISVVRLSNTVPSPYTPASKADGEGAQPSAASSVTLSAEAARAAGEQPAVSKAAEVPEAVDIACRQAVELMEANKIADAATLLKGIVDQDPSARTHALLGTAFFRLEQYDKSVEHLEIALKRDPSDVDIPVKLQLAVANDLSQVQDDVAKNPFDVNKLLGPPDPGDLAANPAPPPRHGAKQHIGHAIKVVGKGAAYVTGHVAGGVAGAAIAILCRTIGRPDKGEIWTTWSRKNFIKGMLMLANMRRKLNENNLHDCYPEGSLTGFMEPGATPPPETRHSRTADGSWNNWANPKEGAAGTRFGRNIRRAVTFPDHANLLVPNPREISLKHLTRDEGFKPVPFLNLMAASWIQFMVHDWVSHGDNDNNNLIEVPLGPDDPMRKQFNMTHMFVPRTTPDPTRQPGEAGTPPTYNNEVTHWWDGSQIYGSDPKTQMKLRSGVDGKMRVTADGHLPLGKDGIEETGFKRNWWTGLSMLHEVFVREHNAICDMLKTNHPTWDDQTIFQKARNINALVMAKIHTIEWTPAILPNEKLYHGMKDNWYGAVTKRLHAPEDRHVVPNWRIADDVLGAVMGNKTNKHGVPYSLTEEFVSVYRLHELLPDALQISKIGDDSGVTIPLAQTRMKASHKITDEIKMADLFYSFGGGKRTTADGKEQEMMHPGQLVLNNYPAALQHISVPGFANMDLGTIDLLRDRERGVRYNTFRREIGLNPITDFSQLSPDQKKNEELRQSYHNNVDMIDLMVGNRAEGYRPDGFGFGETMFQIFIINATRRLQADRFFTTDLTEETYTREGLEWADNASMKNVLMRHYPDLAATGLANIDNAFEPWDEGPLDPARHPLRQFAQ